MTILIAVQRRAQGEIWARHLERMGAEVRLVCDLEEAVCALTNGQPNVAIIDMQMAGAAALTISDFANYRRPQTKIIFVNDGRFFSDGSIFRHCTNLCAMVPSCTPAEDIAVLAHHHAMH